MDKKRILTLLDRLDQYQKELENALPERLEDYQQNLQAKRFCERTLQLLIEVCIDICQLLVKELKLGLPDEEETLFDKLAEQGALSEEMSLTLKEMKKFRNVLIHHYAKIDDVLVYRHAQEDRDDFNNFKKEIISFLREKKPVKVQKQP